MEDTKRTLYVFSILFFIIAAVRVVDLIVALVGNQLTTSYIMQMAGVTEELAKTTLIATFAIVGVTILVLIYLGVMGIRQSQDKTTGSAHIVIATICVIILAIGLASTVYSFITSPAKDWVGLLSMVGSVVIGIFYVRSAKALRQG